MRIREFREWVDFELSGYPDRSKVPNYRIFTPTNLGTFSGPFNTGAKNVVLPTMNLPDVVKDFAENMIFFDGVAALQAQQSIELERKWPQELIFLARDTINMTGGMVLVDAYQPIPPHITSGILDQIKNKLLDFILDLEESNITLDSFSDDRTKPEVARNLFNINIYGDRNIVASGDSVRQGVTPVHQGDLGSLVSHLRQLNIESEDLLELERSVSSEPQVADGEFGPCVQGWLGRMLSKAASGTWKIGLEAAPKLLIEALKSYYGF